MDTKTGEVDDRQKRDLITMSTLGMNGRFGNTLLQYAFLRIYARRHGMTVQTPAWSGQQIFGITDPPVSRPLPLLDDHIGEATVIDRLPTPVRNVDLYGYCQYHTRYFAPDREFFRSLYQPIEAVRRPIDEALDRLRQRGATLVAIHLRRGDYGHGRYFIAPSAWYVDWLRQHWDQWDRPVLYVASDGLDAVLPDLAEFSPVTERDLNATIPQSIDYYRDFRVLSQADAVAVSNSSFSFTACMLNSRATMTVRPTLAEGRLVPFDPWDSYPVLNECAEADKMTVYDELLQRFRAAIDAHRRQPTPESLADLQQMRRFTALTWVGTGTEVLPILYLAAMGDVQRLAVHSGVGGLPRTTEDVALVEDALMHLRDGLTAPWAHQYLLAAMLFCNPAELPHEHDLDRIPNWLLTDYLRYLRTVACSAPTL